VDEDTRFHYLLSALDQIITDALDDEIEDFFDDLFDDDYGDTNDYDDGTYLSDDEIDDLLA